MAVNFRDLLNERIHISMTKKLFKMVPRELKTTLKQVLLLSFSEKPDYAAIRKALIICYENEVKS